VVRGGHQPKAEDFEAWRDQMIRMIGPVEITTDDPSNFRAETHYVDLGAVQVAAIAASPCQGIRTAKMIRQSDPALFQLILPLSGTTVIMQDSTQITAGLRDMALYGTSHPWRIQADGMPRGVMAVFPYALLPFPPERVRRALTFSGRDGIGALLAGFLTRVAAGPGRYGVTDGQRLGTILVDLVAAQLAHRFDADDALYGDTHQRALLLKIHAFIQEHLSDPALTPTKIAAAHNISIRQLHRLFKNEEATVAGWIRGRRLDRCRRDLGDPLLRHQPIHAIATRWGFPDAAHFSRAFRAFYGHSPQEYRCMETGAFPAFGDFVRTA
jgi:AraC-like DNA-binding protein